MTFLSQPVIVLTISFLLHLTAHKCTAGISFSVYGLNLPIYFDFKTFLFSINSFYREYGYLFALRPVCSRRGFQFVYFLLQSSNGTITSFQNGFYSVVGVLRIVPEVFVRFFSYQFIQSWTAALPLSCQPPLRVALRSLGQIDL